MSEGYYVLLLNLFAIQTLCSDRVVRLCKNAN